MAIEAVRLAFKYMSPVFYLSDGYLANGAEPWAIPSIESLPKIDVSFANDPSTFMPYARDPETLARPFALPGTPGLEHRVGGIEKQHITGNVNYDPRITTSWLSCARRKSIVQLQTCRRSKSWEERLEGSGSRLGIDLRFDHLSRRENAE
jgi:pyruvate/2-oxoacid:ferredoxin oxidoreductase alpha subunit